MDWSILSTAVKDTAPILGTLVGGPLGTVVAGLIGNAVGIKTGNPADIAKAISTGNFSDVLKELEANHAGLLTYFSNMRPISKISVEVEFSQ